ncbi:MAG: hypothetical protein V2A56_01980 [bacterium]
MTYRDRIGVRDTRRLGGVVRVLAVVLVSAVLVLAAANPARAQFGHNKVNYQTFNWYYIQTEHFDIYYPKDNYNLAEFTGWVSEQSLKKMEADWNYKLEGRISILVYPSQNTFQSNNVGSGEQDESVGGFTEFLKDRAVIPFQGSYELFRHTIHHELTHAVMLRMLYGEGVQSIISGLSRLPVPLWYIEGLAEYESLDGWNDDADLYMRDAIVNDYLPDIRNLGGYFIYKGGQSVLYYFEERYGKKKIGELMNRIRNRRDFARALKEAVGVNLEDLSKRWHRHLKRQIWPTSAKFEAPEDFAVKITDHLKTYNFINTSPALSPEGDRLVMLSDKDDYLSIYLVNTVTSDVIKRVLKSGSDIYLFEQLLWVRPWIDWSPDGTQIAFVAEQAGRDVLYTVNVETGEMTGEYNYKLDGLFSPTWSPSGKQIAFSAHNFGQSDIYVVDVGNPSSVHKVTDDIFSDYDPDWGPNGKILFTSDRKDYAGQVNEDFEMWNYNYHQIDAYLLNPETGKVSRLTDDQYEDRTPTWTSKPDTISFVSNRTGAYNLYMMDLNSGETWAVTDVLTGITTPSWSKRGTVAFSSFYHGGYDIYLYKDPFDPDRRKEPELTYYQQKVRGLIKDEPPAEELEAEDSLSTAERERDSDEIQLASTESIGSLGKPVPDEETGQEVPVMSDSTSAATAESDSTMEQSENQSTSPLIPSNASRIRIISSPPKPASSDTTATTESAGDSTQTGKSSQGSTTGDRQGRRITSTGYQNYIFYSNSLQEVERRDLAEEAPDSIFDESGRFIPKKYTVKFTPDLMYATAGYSTFFGFQGYGQMMFSDILGNHVLYLGTDLYYNFENSNFSLYYVNLPNRYDWGAGIFHTVYFFNYGNIRDVNYGATGQFLYPLSKTKRIDLSASFVNIDRTIWDWPQYDYLPFQKRHFVVPTISYVSDNSLWGWTAPMNGSRYRIGFTWSPSFTNANPDSVTDLWGVDFKTVAFDARQYFHIGRDYDFAFRLAGASSFGEHPQTFFLGGTSGWINPTFNDSIRVQIDDIYFSGFATPLRGAAYYEKWGNRYMLANAEFRFPLIRQLAFGWPLPFFFYNVRGVLFADLGAAWDDNNFRGMVKGSNGQATFGSIAMGYGWGARIGVGFALLKFDMAWQNEWDRVTRPRYLWSLAFDL